MIRLSSRFHFRFRFFCTRTDVNTRHAGIHATVPTVVGAVAVVAAVVLLGVGGGEWGGRSAFAQQGHAAVNEQALDAALAAMAAVPPGDLPAYLAARSQVLAFGPGAIAALDQRAAAENWTAENWLFALCAAICRDRLADPELTAAVERPYGLAPAEYSQFAHGRPAPGRLLAGMGQRATPLLLERWRWTFDDYPFSEGDAGDREREALRSAILFAPATNADFRAQFFLTGILRDATLPEHWRAQAAAGVGQTAPASALSELPAMLAQRDTPALVKRGCIMGLGHVPERGAADALAPFVRRPSADNPAEQDPVDTTNDLRRAAIAALGTLGSAWAWKARGPEMESTAVAVRSACAALLVQALLDFPVDADAISQALSAIAWPPSLEALLEKAADPSLSAAQRAAAQRAVELLRLALSRHR